MCSIPFNFLEQHEIYLVKKLIVHSIIFSPCNLKYKIVYLFHIYSEDDIISSFLNMNWYLKAYMC